MSKARHAVLVHGMGRTPLSMLLLAARLRQRGIRSTTFGYFAGRGSFDAIAARLAERLSTQPEGYLAIGHSLGGLLLRKAIACLPETARPAHLFLLGTPNQPSRLAQRLRHRPIYRALTGDAGQFLADEARLDALEDLDLPITVIAGTAGPTWAKGPFREEPNDGVVALAETRLAGAELRALPLLHTFLMNSAEVADLIAEKAR
ncbi:MAG: alpha/beta hydrolase [Acidobacteria bacterium]|nr:alpha/beta hydrolase [Acidobacteriota bacterium]